MVVTGPEALKEWRERHRVKVPGYQFTPQFKYKRWDGSWVPGEYCHQQADGRWEFLCSRGLLRRLMNDFEIGVAFQVARVAEVESFTKTRADDFARLRDYQVRSFNKALAEGWGRVALATNAGKGAIIALLAAFANWRGDPVLILCDEIAVFDALEGELRQWGGFEPYLVRSGVKQPARSKSSVSLAMVQTLSRRLKDEDNGKGAWHDWLREVRMLLLDEADKSDAASWKSILAACKNSDWRVGFSGSFGTSLYDQLVMDELIGPVIDTVKNAELVEREISARPTIEVYGYDVTSAIPQLPSNWWDLDGTVRRQFIYEHGVTYNVARHAFVGSLIRPDAPTVIIVDKIDHGLALAADIPGAVFLDGSAAEGERLRVLDDFAAGNVKILVVTKILDRGTNRLGYATDVIFASGEGSTTQVLQRIGRGLRRTDGKAELRLVDVLDRLRCDRDDKRAKSAAAYFDSAGKRRLQVYSEEGFEVQLKPYGR